MSSPASTSPSPPPARRIGRTPQPPEPSNVMRWLTLITTVGAIAWTIWLIVLMRNLPHWTGFDTKHPLVSLIVLTGLAGIGIVIAYIALIGLCIKGRPYPIGGLLGIGVLMIWHCFVLYHNLDSWLY